MISVLTFRWRGGIFHYTLQKFFSSNENNAKSEKKRMLSLVEGPVVDLKPAPGGRTLDENGECFVAVCRMLSCRILQWSYGLKLVTFIYF